MREYLKQIRINAGLTQLDAANKLDISESYYNLIESGERLTKMTIDMAQRLASVFNVAIEYIFENERKKG